MNQINSQLDHPGIKFGFDFPKNIIVNGSSISFITQKLGNGSYGIVYRTDNNTALKRVKIDRAPSTDEYVMTHDTAFIHEMASITRLIRCPSVIKASKIIMTDVISGFEMPIYKCTLYDVTKTKIPSDTLKEILYQITYALARAQNKFILYRDLKPSNILLSKPDDLNNLNNLSYEANPNKPILSYDVVLADWGMSIFNYAPHFDTDTSTIQTLWYRAPEVALLTNVNNESMDMWALGVIALELITKKDCIFKSNTIDELINKIIQTIGLPLDKNILTYNILYKYKYTNTDKLLNFNNICKEYGYDQNLADFISKLLVWDHKIRLTPMEALKHNYFRDIHTKMYEIHSIKLYDDQLERLVNMYDIKINKHDMNKTYLFNRFELINLCNQLCALLKLGLSDLILIIKYMDIFMSKYPSLDKDHYQLMLLSICIICNSLHDNLVVGLTDIKNTSSKHKNIFLKQYDKYTERDLEIMITYILDILEFELIVPTPAMYKRVIIIEDNNIDKLINYLLTITIFDTLMIGHTSAIIFGSILYIISKINKYVNTKIAQNCLNILKIVPHSLSVVQRIIEYCVLYNVLHDKYTDELNLVTQLKTDLFLYVL